MNRTAARTLGAILIGGALIVPAVAPVASGSRHQPQAAAEASGPAPELGAMPMYQRMQEMMEEMAKIHETTDPAERRELMAQHMASMGDMMNMMHGMMAGQGMMSGRQRGMGPGMGMGSGMMNPQTPAPATTPPCTGPSDMRAPGAPMNPATGQMDMLEERLNMMQMMMDQMLKSQQELLKNQQ